MIHRCCLLALLLAGCAGPLATASGPSSPSDASSAVGTVSLPASVDPGPSTAASAPPLPDSFPVHESMEEEPPAAGLTARWTADAPPPEVYEFYLEALVDAGYVIDLEAPGGTAAIIRFHAADGTAYQLNFFGSGPLAVELGAPRE